MIEPISSVMTVQAQGSAVQKNQGVAQVEKNYSEGTPAVGETERIDNTTVVVENTASKGQADYGEQSKDQQMSNEQLKKAVEQLNKSINNAEAIYGIHEGTNRVTIKLVDKDTKKVIKELPPEKTLDMITRVWEMAGILIDERR